MEGCRDTYRPPQTQLMKSQSARAASILISVSLCSSGMKFPSVNQGVIFPSWRSDTMQGNGGMRTGPDK